MRTLITIGDPKLKRRLFPDKTLVRLRKLTKIDWVQEGGPYTEPQLESDIAGYDAVITGWQSPKITREVLRKATKLKFIGHTAGTMVAYIDPQVFEKNITVVNANTALARSTAGCAVALIMAGCWNLPLMFAAARSPQWESKRKARAEGLFQLTIGLVGYGEVSREVIRLLRPFEPRILLYSPYCDEQQAEDLGVELASLHDVMKQCRVVSLHDTLTSSTRGMIGREELEAMQDGALLVNTARAPIVDEAALIDCLKTKRIRAALDVYHREPPLPDYELLQMPNVICTPHIAGASEYWSSRLGDMVVEDMERWQRGEKPLRPVTLEKLRRMTEE